MIQSFKVTIDLHQLQLVFEWKPNVLPDNRSSCSRQLSMLLK